MQLPAPVQPLGSPVRSDGGAGSCLSPGPGRRQSGADAALAGLFPSPRAKAEGNLFHIRLVRYIALASILLTLVLLILNLRSAGLGEAMGAALNAALVIVSAPMVCSNFFVLPIFCWGTLIMGSFTKKN